MRRAGSTRRRSSCNRSWSPSIPRSARRRLEADDRNYDITDSDFQFDLAASHNALGTIRDEQGRRHAAVEEFRRAKRLLDALVLDHPGVTRFEGRARLDAHRAGSLARLDRGSRPRPRDPRGTGRR